MTEKDLRYKLDCEDPKKKYDEYVINPSVLYNSKLKSLYNSDEGDIVVNVGNLKRATYEHVTYGNYKKK